MAYYLEMHRRAPKGRETEIPRLADCVPKLGPYLPPGSVPRARRHPGPFSDHLRVLLPQNTALRFKTTLRYHLQ